MRSSWKPILFTGLLPLQSVLYKRATFLNNSFLDQRILIYNGKKPISLKIRSNFLLRPIGSFVKTRTVGAQRSKKK